MALNANKLAEKMLSYMSNSTDAKRTNIGYVNAVREHILEYAELNGIYMGMTKDKKPDPFNGTGIWKCISCELDGEKIFNNIKNSTNDYISKFNVVMTNEIKEKTIFGDIDKNNKITIENVNIISISINIDMSSKPTKKENSVLKKADGIIQALKKSIPQSTASAKTAMGEGTVTFTNIF